MTFLQALKDHEVDERRFLLALNKTACEKEEKLIASIGWEKYDLWHHAHYETPRTVDWGKEDFQNRLISIFSNTLFTANWIKYGKNVWPLLFSGFFPKHHYFKCFSCGLCLERVEDIQVDIVTLHTFARPHCEYMRENKDRVTAMCEGMSAMYQN